ncbi:PPE family protein, SVP subgroup [Mycolicibacter sinensis]
MDFAALPPEVNSGLMYAGAGPGSMLSAATAWDGLATELHLAATAYESVVTDLTSGPWLGPSAVAMAASITPFVSWLNMTSVQAEKTGMQAKAAVAAYEATFATVVPPPAIAANRAALMTLLATNILGQNAAAIAANEAEYAAMWAQDASAMYSYASLSATATEMEPFQPPPHTANPAGPLNGSEAAGLNSAANTAQTLPSKLASALPGSSDAGSQFPAMLAQADVPTGPFDWLGIIADETALGIALPLSILGVWLAGAAMYFAEQDSREIFDTQDLLYGGQKNILDGLTQLGAEVEVPSTENLRVPHESVKVGHAIPLGALSAPPAWAQVAPEIRHASFSTPLSAAASPTPAGLGTAFGQMALAGMGGSALAGAVNQNRGQQTKTPEAGKAAPAASVDPAAAESGPGAPVAAAHSPASSVVELAAGIRELGELHDAGYLTEAEFAEQKRRLLARG